LAGRVFFEFSKIFAIFEILGTLCRVAGSLSGGSLGVIGPGIRGLELIFIDGKPRCIGHRVWSEQLRLSPFQPHRGSWPQAPNRSL
jgi:hypothetical protein